jgi:single-strand DNA-binding protein
MSDIEYRVGTISKEDPVLKYLESGKAVCNFTVRVPGVKANATYGRVAQEPYFLEVAAWEQLGENVAESMRKGDRVILQGLAKDREWTDKQGVTHHVKGFTAWDAGLSVMYNTAEAIVTEKQGPQSVGPLESTSDSFAPIS